MTTEEETLITEDDMSVEDDDIILASQIYRNNKNTSYPKLEGTKKNCDSEQSDLFMSRTRNENNDNSECFNFITNKMTGLKVFQKLPSTDFVVNTQEDIFSSHLNKDHKNYFFNSGLKLDSISESENFKPCLNSSDCEVGKHNKNSYSNCEIKNDINNVSVSSTILLSEKAMYSDFDTRTKENLRISDTSQTLFTDDSSSYLLKSCYNENLTSGIILPTQPNKSFHAESSNYFLKGSEYDSGINKACSHNISYWSTRESDELALGFKTKTLKFDLSVSCLVITSTNTNKIMNKFILNVNELPKGTNDWDNKVENPSTHSKANRERFTHHLNSYCGNSLNETPSLYGDYSAELSENKKFLKHLEKASSASDRIHWTNEYLLAMKLDELVKNSLGSPTERQKQTNRQAHASRPYQKQVDKKFYEQGKHNRKDSSIFQAGGTSNPKNAASHVKTCKVDKKIFTESLSEANLRQKNQKTSDRYEDHTARELFPGGNFDFDESEDNVEGPNTNEVRSTNHNGIHPGSATKKSFKREHSRNPSEFDIEKDAKRVRLNRRKIEFI